MWQGFGDGVDCRSDFSEKMPEASPSSTMELLLVKAEPFSTGSTSVITYLRKCKRHCTTAGEKEECECERNSSADTLGRAEGGAGAAPGSRAGIALRSCGAAHREAAEPLQPLKGKGVQRSTCSPWRSPCQSRGMSEGGCDSKGGLCWSRVLAESVERGALIGEGLYLMERDSCLST